MSKTDTVARFSLILVRKVCFSGTVHFARIFAKKWPKPPVRSLSLLKITTPRGVLGMGGALASAKFAHGPVCTRMVCSRALSRSALSQPCLRAPASALELARRGHVVVQRFHVVKALHCRRRAGPGRQHRLVVRVAALLTRPGLRPLSLPPKLSPCWVHSHQKDAPAGVAAEETELSRPSHRSMLRLLTVEAAEQSDSHCTAASFLCLDQPAAAAEPIDACT